MKHISFKMSFQFGRLRVSGYAAQNQSDLEMTSYHLKNRIELMTPICYRLRYFCIAIQTKDMSPITFDQRGPTAPMPNPRRLIVEK
jgi:hypothetical protein